MDDIFIRSPIAFRTKFSDEMLGALKKTAIDTLTAFCLELVNLHATFVRDIFNCAMVS